MNTNIQNASPTVSVIMPSYNAERFLETAIRSVINQTMTDFELIIVDDCSKDSSFDIANRIAETDERITVHRNEKNSGVAKTRNYGIDLAKGSYIAFIDSDDAWHPEKLQRQVERIRETNADICYCSYAIIDSEGNKTKADYLVPPVVTYKDILKENCVQCSAMLIPSSIVKEIKFNTEFYHEDYVLGLDILSRGGIAAGCTEILLDWRYLENSRSFDKRKAAGNRWKIYRNYLKLPLLKASWLFVCYTTAGLRKYLSKHK